MNIKFGLSILFCLAIVAFSSAQEDKEEEESEMELPDVPAQPPRQPVQPAQPPKKKLEEPTKPKIKRIELQGPDPCLARPCKKGEECILKEDDPNKYDCRCISSCANLEYTDPVCTSTNKTYNTECEYYRMQCLCRAGNAGCSDSGVQNTYLLHYSPCTVYYCSKDYDYQDYPARLALWLQMVFFEKARMTEHDNIDDLDILAPMDTKYRVSQNSMYALLPGPNGTANATFVTWWFCNLDKDNNNFLEKQESAMLIRALIPSDQCIVTFLGQCDSSGDNKISYEEWHKCFEVQKAYQVASCTDLNKVSGG